MNTKLIIGLDPGSASGAWGMVDQHGKYIDCGAILSDEGRIEVESLFAILRFYADQYDEVYIAVEDVHTMPNQGIASSGKFMRAAGAIEAVATIVGNKMILVRPQLWKKHHNLIGTEKAASLELARSIWPEAPLKLKKHHNQADALLIALWLAHQKPSQFG